MFLVPLITLLTEAMQKTFDSDYPVEDFREVLVSPEYPVDEQHYPSIWVDFDPAAELEIMGVDHRETTDPAEDGSVRKFTRWRFQGYATYTVVSMSSLERARLFDEVIRVMAFGREIPSTSEFRTYIEDNEFLAVNFDFDQIGITGMAATPGTPWGTDEIIYEATVRMECIGEFVSDGVSQTLIPLSAIEVVSSPSNEPDPDPTDTDGAWL